MMCHNTQAEELQTGTMKRAKQSIRDSLRNARNILGGLTSVGIFQPNQDLDEIERVVVPKFLATIAHFSPDMQAYMARSLCTYIVLPASRLFTEDHAIKLVRRDLGDKWVATVRQYREDYEQDWPQRIINDYG
jgi:hypothetical protein